MFSKTGVLNSIKKINFPIKRNIHWISRNNENVYTLGLNKIDNVNNLDINRENYINKYSYLFSIETDSFEYSVKSPFDCKIISYNRGFYDNFKYRGCKDNIWIMKIKPIKFIKNTNYNKIDEYVLMHEYPVYYG